MDLKVKAMASSWYVPHNLHDPAIQDALLGYGLCCKDIAGDCDSLSSALCHGIRHCRWSLTSVVGCTIKTHKPPGDVSLRIIHRSSSHPFKPGMRFVAHKIRGILEKHQHLLRDSDHLLSQIRGRRFSSACKIVKFDLKDFYMSGNHDELAMFYVRLGVVCEANVSVAAAQFLFGSP